MPFATITTQFEEVITSHTTGELQNIQTTYKLNETNYLKWSQFVRTFMKGKKNQVIS